MKTYLISYDLIGPETSADYTKLINTIKTSTYWAKPLKSLWLIKSNHSSPKIRDILKKDIDNNDKLLVIEVTNNWASVRLGGEVVKWMQGGL